MAFYCLATCTNLLAQQVYVDDLKFTGNKEISSGKLEQAIKTQATPWYNTFLFWKEDKIFDEKTFLNDLLRIEKFYQKEGYLQARVADYELNYNKKGNRVSAVISIAEGRPALVEQVEFLPANGVSLPLERKTLEKMVVLKNGRRYREEDLWRDYNTFNNRFSNLGYPYIQTRVKPVVDHQNHTVTLEWQLDTGPFCVFGDISISGNQSISDKVIRRGLEFKEGRRFEENRLARSQSQIYRLQLFQYVNLRATNLDERPTQIPIEVQVKETKIRTLKLGAGYGSEEGFRATANWVHRNFFGGARILRAELKHASNLVPFNAELEFSQPFFLDNQNDLVVKPFFTWQDEESFEARRIGFETTFNRQLDNVTNAFTTVRIERDTVRAKGGALVQELDDAYNKSILQVGATWNDADQLFNPTKGYTAKLVAEEAGLLFQSRFRYYKLSGEYRVYQQLQPGYVLASRLAAGAMKPYRNSIITPVEERFFAGGSYSVRGWGRQQLGPQIHNPANDQRTPAGGNSKLEGSLELRFPIYKDFSGAAFGDFGNVWAEANGFDLLDLKFSIGAGLRYMTPIGPLRVDLARKINKQFPEESDFQVHLSIGQAF